MQQRCQGDTWTMTVFQVSCPDCIETAEWGKGLCKQPPLSFAFTSGAGALGGSFASLSLEEWLSVSESEELSESLVLPDSELLECADATLLGWDCKELQGHHEIKLESSMAEGYLLILTGQYSKITGTPCFGTELRREKAREIYWHTQKIKHQNTKLLEILKAATPAQSNM